MNPPDRPEDTAYPSEEELDFIASWPLEGSPRELFEYIQSIWNYSAFAKIEKVTSELGWPAYQVTLVTGGWSGNESIISAIAQAGDGISWSAFWLQSKRGGFFQFEISEKNWLTWGSES
jgi:hypothetical protein